MHAKFSESTESIDVSYVAHLARLDLSDEEREVFQAQLEDVLAYVNQLKELDVEGIEPMAHAVPLENVFREDEPAECLDRDQVMQNAPLARDGQFVLPRIVE